MPVKDRRLTIHLEPEGHYVSLDTFAAAIQDLKQMVRGLRPPLPDHEGPVKWLVTQLEIGSATVAAEPVADPLVSDTLLTLVCKGVEALERDEDPPAYFGREAIAAVKSMVETAVRDQTRVTFISNGNRTSVTERTVATAKRILEVIVWEDYGSVDGTLEVVNLHSGYQCNVYDGLTGRRVQCYFRESDLDRVREALGRRVAVTGWVRYNRHGDVLSLRAESFDIFPDQKTLPTVDDILGIAPNLTGGVPAEVHVRRLRDDD